MSDKVDNVIIDESEFEEWNLNGFNCNRYLRIAEGETKRIEVKFGKCSMNRIE